MAFDIRRQKTMNPELLSRLNGKGGVRNNPINHQLQEWGMWNVIGQWLTLGWSVTRCYQPLMNLHEEPSSLPELKRIELSCWFELISKEAGAAGRLICLFSATLMCWGPVDSFSPKPRSVDVDLDPCQVRWCQLAWLSYCVQLTQLKMERSIKCGKIMRRKWDQSSI